MDMFNHDAVQQLISDREGPCVSIFLSTHPTGRDGEQDRIRLKNLVAEAEDQLSGHWMRSADARDFVQPIQGVADDMGFWKHRSHGLAVYAAPGFLQCFRVESPLAESVQIAHRFRIRPLLPLLENNQTFLLLALSGKQTALYSVDERAIRQIEVPNLPSNMSDLLNYASVDRGSQTHSADPARLGKQSAVFHGQGGQPETRNEDQLEFCTRVHEAVDAWLGDSTQPLLLACVDSMSALYREKNTYKHLLSDSYSGNHDHESVHELQQGAWEVARPQLNARADVAVTRFAERSGARVTDDPTEVIRAALSGQVATLFYDPQAELYGEYEAPNQEISVTGDSGHEDLVDLAAIETIRHRGEIYSMVDRNVPTNAPLAALLRY